MQVKIDERTKKAIETALSDSAKIEITPTKTGFMVFSVKRKKIAEIHIEPVCE